MESGTNDPVAIFLTIMLIQILLSGEQSWRELFSLLGKQAIIGSAIGLAGGRAIVFVLNRLDLPQGLHAPFVATAALVVFALTQSAGGSGFLAAYIAGLLVGNSATRAHNSLVAFLDAATWLAQIAMFVLLGLLAWPSRLIENALPALLVALVLMFVARPAAVFLTLLPFRFSIRDKLFVSWVGLRGAVSIFIASIPMLVGLPNSQVFFDVAFMVVLVSLLVQGWTIAPAARALRISLPRPEVIPHRTELDLPGQLEQEIVGYPVVAGSPYLRRGITPSWAKLTLVVRDQRVHTPLEAGPVREGDHVYFLAPPERVHALDRFFVDQPLPAAADAGVIEDFFVPGDATLGALAEIYGLSVPADKAGEKLVEFFDEQFIRPPREGDRLPLGDIILIAHTVTDGRVTTVGLQLAEPEPHPQTSKDRIRLMMRRAARRLRARMRKRS